MQPQRSISFDTSLKDDASTVGSQSSTHTAHRHRRQHSQGFFEPSLSITSSSNTPTNHLAASAIAAQAAVGLHSRRRSETLPTPAAGPQTTTGLRKQQPQPTTHHHDSVSSGSRDDSQTRSTLRVGTQNSTAAYAASAAYPRSPILSPVPQHTTQTDSHVVPDREQKPGKERTRRNFFSKPKSVITNAKEPEKRAAPILNSPRRIGVYPSGSSSHIAAQSTDSLADTMSSTSSIYSVSNASTSTLVPNERGALPGKEKTRHNFLHRQKNKLKDGSELYSSANSNSRPVDPNAQPLYSFAPSTTTSTTNVTKSKTGFDLRHGGRALREKKREEKAAAGTFVPPLAKALSSADINSRDPSLSIGADRPPVNSYTAAGSLSGSAGASAASKLELAQGLGGFGLAGMTLDDAWPLLKARLLNLFEGEDIRTPIEDFNKLVVAHIQRCAQHKMPGLFMEDLRELLETGFFSLDQMLKRESDDRLVPHLVETWSFVFGTILPFMQAVFLPFDLEVRSNRRSPLFSSGAAAREPRDAAATNSVIYAGSNFPPSTSPFAQSSAASSSNSSAAPPPRQTISSPDVDVIDVRTLVLTVFRDTVILPRYDTLLQIFSRLSLDSISNVGMPYPPTSPSSGADLSTSSSGGGRVGPFDAALMAATSYNSQASTLLDTTGTSASSIPSTGSFSAQSQGRSGRSRATSNVSALSAGSFSVPSTSSSSGYYQRPHANSNNSSASTTLPALRSTSTLNTFPQLPDSSTITSTAARMLQCFSVLGGLQVPGTAAAGAWQGTTRGDRSTIIDYSSSSGGGRAAHHLAARAKIDNLGKQLKLNWLGRSRTGRNRRGLVGTRHNVVDGVGA